APEIAAPPPPGMQIAVPPPAPAPIEEVAPPPAPVIADPAAAPPPVDNAATEMAPPAPAVEAPAPEPAPVVEEAPAEPEPAAEQVAPQNVPLAERDRDPKGGILLTEDEDISLRYPAGMLLKSDETSECWNGLEEDKSIKDDDLRLFDLILQDAINEDVADLHIKEDHYIHFRMSRGLRDRDWPKPTRKWIERVIFHMCPEHFVEQFKEDRETDFSYFDPKFGRFRVNVFSQCSKWALAMRYVKNDLPPIEKLGIHPICLQLAEAKRGLTLLAGITGSGKSTTMAAMVMHLNKNFRKHIITIEDPVEMVFEDEQCVIEQREVGLDTMSFQRALKSALREDPDMVLVGEMRDATSIGAAMRAADTGAMVLSTVHTRTASSVPGRLLDFFPEEEREMQRKKYAEVIVGAVAQRMCPTIDGGMCPAQEVMIGTPLVKQKIFDGELNRLEACINASEDDGMFTFNRCMYNLVEEGKITKEIALANATNPQQLEMWFQGIEINTGIV
ncbi:MAG: PilT/PilU family type 4a pilus ATPase, partial [Verrucomicrobiota bacterium]|nr:PilT/PilU family type 4a pilus ATPase [Verrucomicrobiota bacterium]